MKPNLKLLLSPANPADPATSNPENSQGAADQLASSAHPIQDPDSPQLRLPFPTDPPKSASHPESRTESQKRALHYAIQTELSSLSTLADALDMYLRVGRRFDEYKVRQGATDLLRTIALAQREYAKSDKLLQES